MFATVGSFVAAVLAGGVAWSLGEYLLHRFAMHELKGRGIMSREHLEHHVLAAWRFDVMLVLAWVGIAVAGIVVWGPVGWLAAGPAVGIGLGLGWIGAYALYEYVHAQAHLRGPVGTYSRWLRKHHFHHHFGHPMANHGVTSPVWDRVFGTLERPERVRVPRRLAPVWLLDEEGEVRPELVGDYQVVGAAGADERLLALDRARAFASIAPQD